MVERDNKKWYWCLTYLREGDYDGLYVTHLDSEDDEWVKNRDNWGKHKEKRLANESSSNSSNASDLKLNLRENMKKALTTTHGFSESEA